MGTLRFRLPDRVRLLPSFAADGDTPALAAKVRLARLLASTSQDPPRLSAPSQFEVWTSVNVWLSESQHAALMAITATTSLDEAEVATSLLWADAQTECALAPAAAPVEEIGQDELSQVLIASGKSPGRTEQRRFYEALTSFVDNAKSHQVLFAEAGTGVGKTYAMLTLAARQVLQDPEQCVAITFPTYSVLEQSHAAWMTLRTEALGGERPHCQVVLSQSAFVSLSALESWLLDIGDPELETSVRAWIAAGGPAPSEYIVDSKWLVRGLEHWCEGLLNEQYEADINVSARRADDDPGYLSYLSQKPSHKHGHTRGVYMMTHAMLATMIRASRSDARANLREHAESVIKDARDEWLAADAAQRTSTLREVMNDVLAASQDGDTAPLTFMDLLIVDEAHTFDEWVSKVLGIDVSLWSILRDARTLRAEFPKAVSAAAVTKLEQTFEFLRGVGSTADADQDVGTRYLGLLWTAIQEFGSVTGKAAATQQGRRIRRVVSLAKLVANQRTSVNTYMAKLNWSPDRRWPRIVAGRQSVVLEMDWLWSKLAGRSILVSATLYDQMPQLSPESARQNLGVRRDAMVAMEPQHPEWTFTPVTFYRAKLVEQLGGGHRFVRPKISSPQTEKEVAARQAWAKDVADYICQAWSTAAGSVLVLLTSYADLEMISEYLASQRADMPVLRQVPKRSLDYTKLEFEALRRNGHRPTLLMVGAGWTGFDVSLPDIPDALTDLVLPLMPFGVNRSITQARREAIKGVYPMIYAATMMMRQGLGRLVRAPDVPRNRRIHFLDARWDIEGKRGLYSGIMRWITSRYGALREV